MKAVKFFGLMAISMIFICQYALAGKLEWDFEDAGQIDDLEIINGTWEINDGVLQEITGGEKGMRAYFGEAEWEDYTVEAKIRADQGAADSFVGLVFRAISEFECYYFYLELRDIVNPGDLCFFKGVPPGFSNRERPNPNKTDLREMKELEAGKWFTMKIVVEGNDFQVFINDEEVVPEATDNLGNEYEAGKVGVFSWSTKVSFDDFKISGPGFAVDSRGKLATTWSRLKQE